MAEYIDRERIVLKTCGGCTRQVDLLCRHPEPCGRLIDAFLTTDAADVAPVVHGIPMLRYRPERYERYEEYGLNENGEMLYLKRVFVDEKSYAMYCPACGKRLCSRFRNFCPNCGAKMDGGNERENKT